MPEGSVASQTLDHEQAPVSESPAPSLPSEPEPVTRKRDLYGRTEMPPRKDPGNGPLQPLHQAASSGNVEKLKALLDENPSSSSMEAPTGLTCWLPVTADAPS